MKITPKFIVLLLIIVLGIFLRFYKLGEVPISPDWDEVALGYNAYSILKTGKDEYGTFLPLSLRSYDDYKPPLYVYLTVPSVAIFGLSVWSTRLPGAILGVLAVIGTFLLTREFLRKYDQGERIALVASFLLAISPWHLQFSRIAFEANIGVTLNIWAFYCFFKGLSKKWCLPLAAFFSALSLWAYHSERLFMPLMVLVLVSIYRKQLFTRDNLRSVIVSCIIGFIIAAPLIIVILSKSAFSRLGGTSWLSDKTELLKASVKKIEDDKSVGDQIGAFFDNRRWVYITTFAEGYLSHFSFSWLFLIGDNPRHHAPDMGLLYLVELPFFLYGLYCALKINRKEAVVLFIWLLLSPLPAAPTTGLPHAIRTIVFLPVIQIITAMGLINILFLLIKQRKMIKFGILSVIFIGFLFNFFYYLDKYFIQMNHEYAGYWQYGYRQAVEYAEANKSKYQKVVVSTLLEQPYMFFLFYTKFDPNKYLALGGTKSGGFWENMNRFDKYEFRKIDWPNEQKDGSILYVGSFKEIPHRIESKIVSFSGDSGIEIADRD